MMFFAPIIDGKFLPENPTNMIKNKNWNQVPYMIGINNTEGAGMLTMDHPVGIKDGLSKNDCKDYVKELLMMEVDVSHMFVDCFCFFGYFNKLHSM